MKNITKIDYHHLVQSNINSIIRSWYDKEIKLSYEEVAKNLMDILCFEFLCNNIEIIQDKKILSKIIKYDMFFTKLFTHLQANDEVTKGNFAIKGSEFIKQIVKITQNSLDTEDSFLNYDSSVCSQVCLDILQEINKDVRDFLGSVHQK